MSDTSVTGERSVHRSGKRLSERQLVAVALVSLLALLGSLFVSALYDSDEAMSYQKVVADNAACRSAHAEPPVSNGRDDVIVVKSELPTVSSRDDVIFINPDPHSVLAETLYDASHCSWPEIKPWFEYIPEWCVLVVLGISLIVLLTSMRMLHDYYGKDCP